ncbi:MAG: peroxiredoxin [Tissierellia bacterium]|nr:peroxiredoxin [Tissierellia bacterium]
MNYIQKNVEYFKVPAYANGEITEISLDDLKGHWSVLIFYPGDFTFVCPTELEDLQNLYHKFKEKNCEIYSVSTDSEFVHKAWHDKSEAIGKVEYPMLSDRSFELSEQFNVLIDGQGQSERATFLIDPDGKVVLYEVSAGGIGRNATELFRKLTAAQYVAKHGDKVCPANWMEGDETLTPGLDLVGEI